MINIASSARRVQSRYRYDHRPPPPVTFARSSHHIHSALHHPTV